MMAVAHVHSIIDQLIENGYRSTRQMGRLTRHGEARIKDCFKFDLVEGYRMLGIMRGREITLLFVGSHDDCDRWIKNNYDRVPPADRQRTLIMEIKEDERPIPPRSFEEIKPEPDYDEQVLKSLTEGQLRKIFCGICGG